MQQPDLFGAPAESKPRTEHTQYLLNQLIKLGDMLGDGLGNEPGEEWIRKEYRAICKQLGYIKPKPRRNNAPMINASVAKYLETASCECGAQMVQTRSGSQRVTCIACRKTYQLKPAKRKA